MKVLGSVFREPSEGVLHRSSRPLLSAVCNRISECIVSPVHAPIDIATVCQNVSPKEVVEMLRMAYPTLSSDIEPGIRGSMLSLTE